MYVNRQCKSLAKHAWIHRCARAMQRAPSMDLHRLHRTCSVLAAGASAGLLAAAAPAVAAPSFFARLLGPSCPAAESSLWRTPGRFNIRPYAFTGSVR